MFAFIITQAQSPLQLQPAIPSILRNGDRMEFQLTIQNSSNQDQTGQAELQLTDAETGVSIDGWFQNVFPNQYFTAEAKGAAVASFPIEVPYLFFKRAAWRFIVRTPADSLVTSGSFPVLPVLQPYSQTALFSGAGSFSFSELIQSGESDTRQNMGLRIQVAASPVAFAYTALTALLKQSATTAPDISNQLFAATLLHHLELKQPAAFTALKYSGARPLQQVVAQLDKHLRSLQQPDGGFSLLPGGKADAASSWLVAANLARLKALKAPVSKELHQALAKASAYLASTQHTLPAVALAYLESLSGPALMVAKGQQWISVAMGQQPRWLQAMTAVVLHRLGKAEQAAQVYRKTLEAQQMPEAQTSDPVQLVADNSLLLEYAQLAGDTAVMGKHLSQVLQQDLEDSYSATGNAYALLLQQYKWVPLGTASVQMGKLPELQVRSALLYDTIIAGALVQPALANIAIRQVAKTPLLTRVHWQYVDEQEAVNGQALKVARTCQSFEGREPEPLTAGPRITQGSILVLTIVIDNTSDVPNALLSVGIPAGLKPTQDQPKGTYAEDGALYFYFPRLSPGNTRLNFTFQAIHKGSFGSGPVEMKTLGASSLLIRLNSETVWVE